MKQVNILVVDDDLSSILLMSRMLAAVGEVQFATNGEDALRLMRESRPALVLLDAEMPGMSGYQLCEAIKADPVLADTPVIFVTSHNETHFEVAGFDIGAADFIAKPVSGPLLVARVKTQLRLSQLATELRRVATIDGLTQAVNRRHFDEVLLKEWQRTRRSMAPISLLMIDVDHFKRFNDRYGHPAGDGCLQRLAGALQQACLRPADLVARYGGEEFVMLLPETDGPGAEHVAERVLANVESLAIAHDASLTSLHVTVSVGVGSFDEHSAGWITQAPELRSVAEGAAGVSPAQLLRAADIALYAAKAAGRAQAWLLDAARSEAPAEAREVLAPARLRQFVQAA